MDDMEEEATLYWTNPRLITQQKQLLKPTLAQLMSQRFSCQILFNLLASGEKCVAHYHKDRKYRYYDPYTTAKIKDQDDLELEFRNQVRCFQTCFIDDVEKGGFRYPDNLSKKDIIDDIKNWINFANFHGRDVLLKTYQQLIELFEKEKKIVVDKVKTSKNNDPNIINKGIFEGVNKKEASNFINAGLLSNKTAFELETKIKKDYEKGDYSIKAYIYCDPPEQKNYFFGKIGENIKYVYDETYNFFFCKSDNK